jgi:hypothetical protein
MTSGLRQEIIHGWPVRAASWAFFYGLSLNFLLATVAALRFLGVEYGIGYQIHVANAAVLSDQLDPVIWLLVTAVTAVTALMLAVDSGGNERVSWELYAIVAVAGIGLQASGHAILAYGISLVLGLFFLALTILPAEHPVLRTKRNGFFMTLTGIFALLFIVESLALIAHVLAVLPNIKPADALSNVQTLQDELSGSLFDYSTILMLSALFVWIPALPLILHAQPRGRVTARESRQEPNRTRLVSFALLGLAVLVAIIVPLLPYVNSVQLQGVDAPFYYQHLSSTSSISQAIGMLGAEPREPYILLLFIVERLTGWNALQTTIFGPVILGVSFAASAYLLAWELLEDPLTAGIAAFLASTSLHMTVGLYAAIYANWLAMSVALLFLYLLERSLRKPTFVLVLLTTLTSFVVAFIHAWTWGMMMSAVLVALALMSVGGRRDFIKTRGPVILLAWSPLLVAIFAGVFGFFKGITDAIFFDVHDIVGSMSLARLGSVYLNFSYTLHSYVGSLLAYPLLLFLAAVGGLSIALSELPRARLLVAWLLVTSVSALLLDPWFQWRLLFIIPFELLASAGIVTLLSVVDWAASLYGPRNLRLVHVVKLVLVAVLLMDFVNYAVRGDLILTASAG